MKKVMVYNNVSLDGYFVDAKGNMSWAHKRDPAWNEFVAENTQGGSVLLFGRVTYDLMAGFWPTETAIKTLPAVAERMNNGPKVVFSRAMRKASWNNTKLIKGDPGGGSAKYEADNLNLLTQCGSERSKLETVADERNRTPKEMKS